MRLSDFDFSLPPELIAQQPAARRDASRLLHVKPDGLADHMLGDLPQLLRPGDLLVFNNTRVIPARLRGRRGEVAVELTLHQQKGDGWEVFARPGKRLKPGQRINFAKDFLAEILAKNEDGTLLLRFEPEDRFFLMLEKYGEMPLPPYIRRQEQNPEDAERYQTVYARKMGAVAAPTAGLHFTPELFEALKRRGVESCFLTLHVGAGTFLPVKTENISEHKMHAEYFEILPEAAAQITQAKREGRRVVAVGTTSLRSLEAIAAEDGGVEPFQGETRIFITPGYNFKCVDALFTNFHLPKSTLFMLVSAFAGLERMRQAYAHAVAERYRFFSYGDACLLERSA